MIKLKVFSISFQSDDPGSMAVSLLHDAVVVCHYSKLVTRQELKIIGTTKTWRPADLLERDLQSLSNKVLDMSEFAQTLYSRLHTEVLIYLGKEVNNNALLSFVAYPVVANLSLRCIAAENGFLTWTWMNWIILSMTNTFSVRSRNQTLVTHSSVWRWVYIQRAFEI
mmetsp:Transcript_25581/g.30955  ORF Transcript_25581/g.30955 Transcript_25581/m.30955 type:complete len:167 (-) Transcript_25581:696-1196(-)